MKLREGSLTALMYNLDDDADDAENTVRHDKPVKEGFGCLSPDEEDDGSVGGEDEAAGQGVGEEDGGQGVVVIAGAVLHSGEAQVFSRPKVCGDPNFFHYVSLYFLYSMLCIISLSAQFQMFCMGCIRREAFSFTGAFQCGADII